MAPSLDLSTLRLCSILTSVAFAIVFLGFWRGRRGEAHHAWWGFSLLLYCGTLLALDTIVQKPGSLIGALLLGLLPVSNIMVSTGARRFAGLPLWRWWMTIPVAVTMTGFLAPAWLAYFGVMLPDYSGRVAPIAGLALTMALIGGDLMRISGPGRNGARIAGLALLGYIPCYALAILCDVAQWGPGNLVGIAALMSDQLLLMMLNLGLLAMPAESAFIALRDSAWRDGLTATHNRAWLAAQEEELFLSGISAALIDIDHFKAVNDRFGHAEGDAALVRLAQALCAAVEPLDGHVVRMGGDEFLALLPSASDRVAERFVRAVHNGIGGAARGWTISIGLAFPTASDERLDDMIARADRQLYAAKSGGRNRVAA